VVFESKSRTEITKTAALDMGYFYKPYWDLSGRSMGKQITDTTDMVAKYEADATFVAKGKTIGVDTAMNELKTINTNQQALYLTRNQEVGGRAASGTDLRPGANESYTQLCNVVEQAVNLMPNESLLTLFNNMDQLRVKTHALLTKPNVETDETSIKS